MCDQDPSPQQEDRESYWRTWREKIFGWIADILGMRYGGRTAVPPAMTEAYGALEAAAEILKVWQVQKPMELAFKCAGHPEAKHVECFIRVQQYIAAWAQGRWSPQVGAEYEVCKCFRVLEEATRKYKCGGIRWLKEALENKDFRRWWEVLKARACGRRSTGAKR